MFVSVLLLGCVLQVPRWDTSKLRAKGARLKTFGGRASGPEPLEALFLFAVNLFRCVFCTYQTHHCTHMRPRQCVQADAVKPDSSLRKASTHVLPMSKECVCREVSNACVRPLLLVLCAVLAGVLAGAS
jgi:hypothetical protein